MKTKNILIFIIIVSVIVVFTAGCNKINNPRTELKSNSLASDSKIIRMIEGFKLKIEANLKDGQDLSTDSAIWYAEATLNETYARGDYSKSFLTIDSTFIGIPLNTNSLVSSTSLSDAYRTLVSSLRDHYDAIKDAGKSLILVDVSAVSVNSDSLFIKMTDYFVSKPINPVPFSWTFGFTDHWYWGIGQGKCGGYTGQVGQDATTQLTTYANGALRIGSGTFFANVTTTQDILPPEVPSTGNPFGYNNSLLYWLGGDQCLSPNAMNYYLGNLSSIASIYRPYGKVVCHYTVLWGVTVGSPEEEYHYTRISFGIPVTTNNPPSSL
jgi:hypothetical protein